MGARPEALSWGEEQVSKFRCCVFLLDSNKPGLEESAAASGREQWGGKFLHGTTSLGLRSGFGVPW